jgi:hypothetical protein
VPQTGGTFFGPEIAGKLVPGASAGWQIVRPDGTTLADLRYTLQTDDGALPHVRSSSRPGRRVSSVRLRQTDCDQLYKWASAIRRSGARRRADRILVRASQRRRASSAAKVATKSSCPTISRARGPRAARTAAMAASGGAPTLTSAQAATVPLLPIRPCK